MYICQALFFKELLHFFLHKTDMAMIKRPFFRNSEVSDFTGCSIFGRHMILCIVVNIKHLLNTELTNPQTAWTEVHRKPTVQSLYLRDTVIKTVNMLHGWATTVALAVKLKVR